jgi:hypothetical protein
MPISLAEQLVNQALQKIYDAYNWSFLFAEDYIVTPNLINGTAQFTEFGTTIIVNADLKVILDLIDSVNDVPLENRQIRSIGNDSSVGSVIYTITNYDSLTSTLTINRPYLGPTNSATQVEIFKSFYNPPESAKYEKDGKFYYDFSTINYLIDLTQNRKIRTEITQDLLNKYDLNRTYRGNPASIVPNQVDANGFPVFELYPIPTAKRIYKFIYKKKGRPLINDDDLLPNGISDELIIAKIKDLAYEWIEVNKSIYPELKVINAISLKALLMNINNPSGFPMLLQEAKNKDNDLFPQSFSTYDNMYYLDLNGWMVSEFQPPRETLILNY